ncbi:LPXTG cell wall anchor domain-containing protein [Brevibacterium yomogidense]|uniref:LPXTG cell wall anchor domain-containing protein n=1 Tax=Brevibacterium yomogidense TaxID=946573 RepID=UPI0018DFF8D0|nr:PT domain-containing protein [Brevibacterium yomogidense]
MKTPEGGKRFVALSAAVAIGLGGVALTAPALAASEAPEDLGVAAASALTAGAGVAAVGYNADGDIAVQVVEGSGVDADDDVLKQVSAFAKAETGSDPLVQEIANGYSTVNATDVVGGAGYIVHEPGSQTAAGLCSFGFPATGPNGEDALLTAGHCSDEGNDIYLEKPSTSNAGTGDYTGDLTFDWLTTTPVGTVTHSAWADTTIDPEDPGDWDNPDNYDPASTQDFAVITLDDASIETHAEVTDWTTAGSDDLSASTLDVAGVHDVTMDDIGEPISRSGRTSGYEEGTMGSEELDTIGGIVDGYSIIQDHDGTYVVVYGFAAEALGIPGDSGGAVMMGDQAVGVTSGSNYDPSTGEGDWIWVAELAEGLNNLPGDYEVKTTDDGEEPTEEPTEDPTDDPTEDPTDDPTEDPTDDPTDDPTEDPTVDPTPTETATDEPTTPAPTPTDTDDADEDAELTVDPREIAADRFLAEDEEQAVEEDRGVTYSVTGVEPGSDVTFDTYASTDSASANAGTEAVPAADSDDAPAKSVTVTADEDGNASSRVWGLPTAPAEAYIGDYEVVVTTTDETLNSSFKVVADGGDNGDGGQDDGDNGDDLPRTGSTTGPLATGAAGLVALGGALVYVARRRKA